MFVVLMAGGTGTRFWPRSRKSYPKQLLNIVGSRSMLQLTYDRIKKLTPPEKILIITNKEQKTKIEEQLPSIPKVNIIAEPSGKNTAPCIGLAATVIKKNQDQDEVMVVEIQEGADYDFIDDENNTGTSMLINTFTGDIYNEVIVNKTNFAPLAPEFPGRPPLVHPVRITIETHFINTINSLIVPILQLNKFSITKKVRI